MVYSRYREIAEAGLLVDAICEQFLEMSLAKGAPKHFDGELTSVQCGSISVNRVNSDPLDVVRTRSAIARSSRETYYLLCMPDASWSVKHMGLHSGLGSGDLVLVDSREPYELRFPFAGQARSLGIPAEWLQAWVADPRTLTGRAIGARSGRGAVLSSFVNALTPEYVASMQLSGAILTDQLGGLIASTADDLSAGLRTIRVQPHSLAPAIVRTLKARYTTPGLTATHVARELGVSVRTVHAALSQQGMCFSAALARERMAAAHRMISNPGFDSLPLSEIGRRAGLPEASHFVRLYRHYFGNTPGSERHGRRGDQPPPMKRRGHP